jgi:TetR/AcrR family transcriptional repressor of nem operon
MAPVAERTETEAATRILDVAERLVQLRGFNGFSYADVASELGVTKASLHYHFSGKADLGEALMNRYSRRFAEALDEVDARLDDERDKLAAYADLYADVLRGGRMCLCGMLAADYETLPEPMRRAVVRFLDDNETWLEAVLEAGRRRKTLAFEGPAREAAQLIVSGLEGAMLVARPYGDLARFQAAADRLLAGLFAARPRRRASR